jgi:kynurenine formamidase
MKANMNPQSNRENQIQTGKMRIGLHLGRHIDYPSG